MHSAPDHSGHSHIDVRFVRGGRTFNHRACVETGMLARMDQGEAAIHAMAAERQAAGDYYGALVTLHDYERLAAVAKWLHEGVSPELLTGDPQIQELLTDLIPPS